MLPGGITELDNLPAWSDSAYHVSERVAFVTLKKLLAFNQKAS